MTTLQQGGAMTMIKTKKTKTTYEKNKENNKKLLITDHLPLTTYHLTLTTIHLPLATFQLPFNTWNHPSNINYHSTEKGWMTWISPRSWQLIDSTGQETGSVKTTGLKGHKSLPYILNIQLCTIPLSNKKLHKIVKQIL